MRGAEHQGMVYAFFFAAPLKSTETLPKLESNRYERALRTLQTYR